MPTKKIFSTQNDDENILHVMGKHPFTLFAESIVPALLFLVSFAVMVASVLVPAVIALNPYALIVAFVFFLFSIVWGFYSYFTWAKNKYIITDQRIVDVDQETLFARTQKEAYLEKVQDVSFQVGGFWGALFRFGTVTIQTAGETALTLDDIPHPEKAQKTIFDLVRSRQQSGASSTENDFIKKVAEALKSSMGNTSDTPQQ